MSGKPAESYKLERVQAVSRWSFFVICFLAVHLYSPQAASSMPFYSLAIVAVAYSAILTLLALLRISWPWLPWTTSVLDVLFIVAAVSAGGSESELLLLLPIIPVLSASIYLRGSGGLLLALMVAAFWLYGASKSAGAFPPPDWLPFGLRSLLLLSATASVSFLAHGLQSSASDREKLAEERARLAGEQVQAICELTGNLSATLDYERVLDSILDVGILGLQELGAAQQRPACMVLLFDEESKQPRLRIAACRQLSEKDMRQVFPGQAGVLGEVVGAVEPRIISRTSRDPEIKGIEALRSCASIVAIPIRAGFDLFGVLVFGAKRADAYGEHQLAFLNTLCSQAAIALQNARFYERLQQEKERIISDEAEVRAWLARELHDGPTQTISAVAMRLSYLRFLIEREPEKVGMELNDLELMARRATREIRNTLFKLRPLILESQGFRAALEQYAKRVEEEGGAKIEIDVEEPSQRLNGKVETTIFAIVEEAVNNARKHAKAESVSVRMAPYEGMLVVTIRDNGVGFDLQKVEREYDQGGSMGLVNMRERAELLGGRLEIESRPGFGTIVTLVVPYKSGG